MEMGRPERWDDHRYDLMENGYDVEDAAQQTWISYVMRTCYELYAQLKEVYLPPRE